MLGSAFRPVSKDIELVQPPPDSVSRISFSPTADILAVGSWDNAVRLYDVNSQGQSQPRAMYKHEGPVLDVCWTKDGSKILSAGCDNAVRMYDVASGQSQQVAVHDAAIKCCQYLDMNGGVLVTAGWDKMLKYWDLRTPNPVGQVELGDKAYAMDHAGKMMVVGTANRHLKVFNLDNPMNIWKSDDSPLKWQTRSVACFPNGEAFAVGSVEGRVGIRYPDEPENDPHSKNYSFKCHRYDIGKGSMPNTPAVWNDDKKQYSQHVFAVNCITFHPVHGTFFTGGSDGSLTCWDGLVRTKVKNFVTAFSLRDLNNGDSTDASNPKWGVPIVSSAFNHNQEIFAYALSYDWSKGHSGVPPAGSNTTKIMLHSVRLDEVYKEPKK